MTRLLSFSAVIFLALLLARPGSAALLSGVVTDGAGIGVGNVDVDVHNAVTGVKIPTDNDSTDGDGTFDILVPAGFYDLVFNAPVSSRLVSIRRRGITVAEPETDVGQIVLVPGALLTGTVVRADNAAPVFDADLDVDLSFTGERVVTPSDDTNGAGNFALIVPFGTIDVTFEPRIADGLVALRILAVAVAADVSLGTVSLQPGVQVSGVVRSQGFPVADAEVDVFLPDGSQVPTPGGDTDGNGQYAVVLPPGNVTVKTAPSLGSGLAHATQVVSVAGPMILDVDLVPTVATVEVGEAGRVVLAGSSYRPEVLLLNNTPGPLALRFLIQAVLPSAGITRNVAPPLNRTIPATPAALSGLARVPIPSNLAPRFRGVPLWFQVTVLAQGSGQLVDSDFREFRIQ